MWWPADARLRCIGAGHAVRRVTPGDAQDLADLRALLEAHGDHFDWGYVARWVRDTERELLASITRLQDDALLARLAP